MKVKKVIDNVGRTTGKAVGYGLKVIGTIGVVESLATEVVYYGIATVGDNLVDSCSNKHKKHRKHK